jgi:hypothetical protein
MAVVSVIIVTAPMLPKRKSDFGDGWPLKSYRLVEQETLQGLWEFWVVAGEFGGGDED